MPQLSGNERSCCHHCLKPSAPATSGFGIPPRDDNICFSDCIQHLPETELCKTHNKENFSRTLRIYGCSCSGRQGSLPSSPCLWVSSLITAQHSRRQTRPHMLGEHREQTGWKSLGKDQTCRDLPLTSLDFTRSPSCEGEICIFLPVSPGQVGSPAEAADAQGCSDTTPAPQTSCCRLMLGFNFLHCFKYSEL